MTDKEKAKAYDEALKRAKEIKSKILSSHLSTESCKAVSEYIDTIIPELKESEDERITRAINNMLPFIPDEAYANNGVTKEGVLNWLEKQKEPIPIPDKFSGLKSLLLQYLQSAANRTNDTEIESDTDLFGRKILDYVWKHDDKQKEQKPDNPFTPLEGLDAIKAKYYDAGFKNGFDEGVDSIKPAEWSEDYNEENLQTRFAFYTYKDDPSTLYLSNVFVEEASRNHGFGTRILRAAEKVAETIGATTISLKVKQDSPANAWYRKNGYGYVAFEDGYDWLEKTLEYLKPVKQEWSEEDIEKMVNARARKSGTTKSEICFYRQGIEDTLKSLRPSWKPSDEQMKALDSAINYLTEHTCTPGNSLLVSLFNALQKLS